METNTNENTGNKSGKFGFWPFLMIFGGLIVVIIVLKVLVDMLM